MINYPPRGHGHGHMTHFKSCPLPPKNISKTVKARNYKLSTQVEHIKCQALDERNPLPRCDHGHVIPCMNFGSLIIFWSE